MPSDICYKALIVAGYGAMGQAFFTLAGDFVGQFDTVVVIDKKRPRFLPEACGKFVEQDIENPGPFYDVLYNYAGDFLLVNLTAGTDTFRVRQVVAELDGAYIDTACSMMWSRDESRYSVLMPYTYRAVVNRRPHFLCCGVNPGMVELIARKMIGEHFADSEEVDVLFYELDLFREQNRSPEGIPVSWSPETLIDEVLLAPSLELEQGGAVEGIAPPTHCVTMKWFGREVEARLVGHEEIWNLQDIHGAKVNRCYYAYGFRPEVMDVLRDSVPRAQNLIFIPNRETPVQGMDSLIVKVVDRQRGRAQARMWATDHAQTFERHRINAVQYQVCSSVRLFCELLMQTHAVPEGAYTNASTLDYAQYGWEHIDMLLQRLGIDWQPIDPGAVSLKPYSYGTTRVVGEVSDTRNWKLGLTQFPNDQSDPTDRTDLSDH